MQLRFVRLSILFLIPLLGLSALYAKESIVPKNAKVAVIGDSITEQKLYARFIELYLTVCQPQLETSSFQYGWSGEKTIGFLSRMDLDLQYSNPNFITICYGMNDGSYKPFEPAIGDDYLKNLTQIVQKLKTKGITGVIGGPGAVDTDFFKRSVSSEVYNQNLQKLSEIAKKIAAENQLPFADVHSTMIETMNKAKSALGKDYDVCGTDGIHPQANGHLIMAYAFLKAMGFDGDLGTIQLDFKGESKGINGHQLKSFKEGKAEVESTRYPFCFSEDKTSKSAGSILPFLPFNQELNRFTLIVKNAPSPQMNVKWGDTSKTFTKEQLEQGINLANEFSPNPFNASFDQMSEAILIKETFETELIKSTSRTLRSLEKRFTGDTETSAAISLLDKKTRLKWSEYSKSTKDSFKPVTHTISIEPMK